MAAMSSSDMDYKLQQKGKLQRPDRDKKSRQQEAYKWRDARRVYLAGSFDRWKRIRNKLGLKDSRLAWHLLEAHSNHCVECGKMDNTDSEVSSKDFFPALVKSVRRLCQKHFSFKHSVEVVGLLCLNVDNEEKENFSIKELIQRPIGLRVEALSSNVNHLPNKDCRQPLGTMTNMNVSESESLDAACEENFETETCSQQMSAEGNNSHGESLEYYSEEDDEDECFDTDVIEPDTSTDHISASDTVSSSQENTTAYPPKTTLSQSINHMENMEIPVVDQQNVLSNGVNCSTKKMNKEAFSFAQMTPCILFSEFSTLYPTVSMRTFYRWKKEIADGMDLICKNESVFFSEFQNIFPKVSEEVFFLWKDLISKQSHNASNPTHLYNNTTGETGEHLKGGNSFEKVANSSHDDEWTVQKIDSEEKIKLVLKNKPVPSFEKASSSREMCDVTVVNRSTKSHLSDTNSHELGEHAPLNTTQSPSPLNTTQSPSVSGSDPGEVDNEILDCLSNKANTECDRSQSDVRIVNDVSYSDPIKMEFTDSEEDMQINVHDQVLDSPKRKLETQVDTTVVPSPSGDNGHPSVIDYTNLDVMANCVRKKRKYSSLDGIQHRREVYQKEEYELLEAMPFADYAEFSRHCPNVMKRTYFRWKRRIKEEYMYLEQNADLSFEEFSRVFPQAKQNIFSHWKSLIKQGYNFSSVHYTSDATNHVSSGNTETTDSSEEGLKQSSYNFLQKNYQMEFAEFSKHFPSVTQQTFSVWKKKVQHEVQFLMTNPYYEMEYAVYSQCFPGVSNEVFTAWKRNMQQQLGSPQSVYPAASYWSPYLGQAARYGTVAWPDVKPSLWMNNPLLTHMWGTAMNLSALARSEDANKQQLMRTSSLSVEESCSNRHSKASPSPSLSSSHHVTSESGTSNTIQSPFTQPETDFISPRSRKQNKAEFYHFLQHPEMDFHDMSVAFPNLSLRTFYRWKREIKNAMCILEESHSTPFSEFHIYFPDIPVDIFSKWKEKIAGVDQTVGSEVKETLFKSSANTNVCQSDVSSTKTSTDLSHISLSDVKHKETEFQFLEVNPDISFSQFSLRFPHVSMRTFYTWCKEIHDQINHIRQNPSFSLDDFRQHFPDLSSEVFHIWKDIVLSEHGTASDLESDNLQMNVEGISMESHSPRREPGELSTSPTDLSIKQEHPNHFTEEYPKQKMLVDGVHAKLIHKASRPEYVFLQNNPTIDFREFFLRFPEVSGTTFYRWRREIKEIMDFIQLKPSATYSEVVNYFPDISEDVFAHWKSVIQSGDHSLDVDDPMGSLQAMVDSRSTGDDAQEAFCLVMENPDIDKDEFWQKYPSLSQKLYYKCKKKVKELLLLLHGNPEMDYNVFSTCNSDVPENIFNKWKENLSLFVDKAVSSGVEESTDMDKSVQSSEEWTGPKSRKVNQAEFLFFLMNPFMDYQEFSNNFPQISLRTFYRWRRETRDGLEYLEEYPDVSYKAFCQVFPVVPEDVFEKWKMLISVRNKVKNKACYQNEMPCEVSSAHTRDTDTPPENTANTNEQFLRLNSSGSAESKPSASEEGLVDDVHNSHQETVAINKCDSSSSSPQAHHKSDSSGSFIGFLSAAVENICKSAGLPPLDQSDSNNESHSSQLVRPSVSASAPLKLGGVAFPGLLPHDSDLVASNSSSVADQTTSTASSPDENQPAGLGGIAFPGMTPASCYPISSSNSLMSSTLNNSASSHQNQCSPKSHMIESDSYNHPLSNMIESDSYSHPLSHMIESDSYSHPLSSGNLQQYRLPTSSAFWSFDRQAIKSESLASSPTNDQMNLGTSGATSPSFAAERPSSSRSILNAVKMESPVSGLKSGSSAAGKNGLHDDYFFSPRLRKQNREEYMYLQQNPAMDFQEFYKVYPTISLRTFYRWKREFREDTLLGSFQQKENTNTLNTSGVQHSQILDLSAKPANMFTQSADSGIL